MQSSRTKAAEAKRRTRRIIEFAVCISLAVFTVWCFGHGWGREFRNYELDENSFKASDLKRVAEEIGIKLPPGCRGLNYYFKPPIDPAFIARIEIPMKSKEFVVQEFSRYQSDPPKYQVENYLSNRVTWWNPVERTPLFNKKYSLESGSLFVEVFVVEEDNRCILYVFWSTTG